MLFDRKNILDLASLSVDEIESILTTAGRMKEILARPIPKVPTLRGKTILLFFQEPSTRTRTSFAIAAKRLSADCLTIAVDTTSIVKGETLKDTARNLEAMKPDVIVIRHSSSGVPHMLARVVEASVINAGDGMHAHPSQALLDLFTVKEKKGQIAGLRIAIIGDIAHSRVARSNIVGFTRMGADVVVSGPATMIPIGIESIGAHIVRRVDDAIHDADVIMMLRIQKERQRQLLFPTEREYAREFGLSRQRMQRTRENVLIMHPGPINRGVEIAPEIADGPFSIILDQVTNGVAIRMALLYLVTGGSRHADVD
jgi:aspartate carbamoyltransferase catalytic subunit